MNPDAADWFDRAVSTAADWSAPQLIERKRAAGARVSVVIPARNEQATIGAILDGVRTAWMDQLQLVDELVVMDSLSRDDTAAVARDRGAVVHSVADVRPELGVLPGKGEALWKSLFVTGGDLLVFMDADLTEWSPSFVTGLLGPLLSDERTLLVKGFYDRLMESAPGRHSTEGGRVTELVARPLLASRWPQLSATVQPLGGEWAIRRSLFEQLSVPTGYGVEMAALLDTWQRHGLDSIAQVDLGRRGHRHQALHDLAAMALEIMQVADRRSGLAGPGEPTVALPQHDRSAPTQWAVREVPVEERPPARSMEVRP